MSAATPLPDLSCRTFGRTNPWVYLAPVLVGATGMCICMDCAEARGWLDSGGSLKPGVAQ